MPTTNPLSLESSLKTKPPIQSDTKWMAPVIIPFQDIDEACNFFLDYF
ncbi:hypothetical protein CK203_093007 [Vitis vinifera]|uniref:Uncharacterized protein n=1 Tax=Vitis vinifera TaxID=29760 RepID=A0A438DFR3_VITVI|nr:hypothetical protein CK203_093007 [Vitis vinifera]